MLRCLCSNKRCQIKAFRVFWLLEPCCAPSNNTPRTPADLGLQIYEWFKQETPAVEAFCKMLVGEPDDPDRNELLAA